MQIHPHDNRVQGFTLVELAIVLVIIGLIVGGVLVGQSLIETATNRAQITQIESYRAAVLAFRGKYGGLPGDLPTAANFGFVARNPAIAGRGNGDGIITGNNGEKSQTGEPIVFWRDLSQAGLIANNFSSISSCSDTPTLAAADIPNYYPRAKLNGNYTHVWSGRYSGDGRNYFTVQSINSIDPWMRPLVEAPDFVAGAVTVASAYDIDTKVDDGKPQTGKALALVNSGGFIRWAGGFHYASPVDAGPFTTATAGSAITCFDNNNSGGAEQLYSMNQNSGSGKNCTLTIATGF